METDRVAGLKEPVLTVFSHEFLEHPGPIAEKLRVDFADMLHFVMQQIEQFRSTQPKFEVHHMADKMYQTLEEMEAALLERMSVEKRLRGIPAQERLQGIPAEERLQGLDAEEKKRLRKILDEEIPG